MKKNNIFSAIFKMCLMLIGFVAFTACSEDDLETNQYRQGVELNVYGPCPVMRGGELRFLGSNLDQVEQVVFPGCDPITSIDIVKSGVPSEIKVTVPKDGPEVGKVKLITRTGKEIETITNIAYIEPIELTEMTTDAMPGDVITLKGDYLNLVKSIGFADGLVVSSTKFVAHSRYEIHVAVPLEARTGKISLYDQDLDDPLFDPTSVSYNTIESETALNVGTPTVAKFASPRGEAQLQGSVTAKMGETLTVTGADFRLVKAIAFGDENNVVTFENGIAISEDGKTITIALPATAPDGDIELITLSGVAIPVGKLVTVAPSNLVVDPAIVKNGAELSIVGVDMDVVASVTFPNCEAIAVETTPTEIKVIVPEAAQEGDIILTMENGKSVTVAYSLVKPAVTKYSANPVSAGGALSIEGTNLDLVAQVVFNGSETPVAVEAENDGAVLNLSVPMDAQSGAVTLKLKNGTEVTVEEINIEEAVFCYATELPSADDEIKAGGVLTLVVKNVDKLTGVEINGESCQYIVSGDKLLVGVPENGKKGSAVRLVSSNGEITYKIDFIPNTELTTVVWQGMEDLGSWSAQPYIGAEACLVPLDAKVGCVLRIYVQPTADDWNVQVFHGHWNGQIGGDYNASNTVDNVIEIEIADEEMLAKLNEVQYWGGLFVMQGQHAVVTKVTMTEYFSVEETLWTGEAIADDWGAQPYMLSDGATELIAAGAKPGSVVRFYIEAIGGDAWNLQIVEGHWGSTYCDYNQGNYNLSEHNGAVELPITEEMWTAITTVGGWGGSFILNGDNVKCTKITVE